MWVAADRRQCSGAAAGQPRASRGRTGLSLADGESALLGQGGAQTGPSPVDRARPGSKHHLLVEASGIPLACLLTGGKRNDVTQLIPLLDAVPPLRGCVGHPLRKPGRLLADRGYDHERYRRRLRARGITPFVARRGSEHGFGLGAQR